MGTCDRAGATMTSIMACRSGESAAIHPRVRVSVAVLAAIASLACQPSRASPGQAHASPGVCNLPGLVVVEKQLDGETALIAQTAGVRAATLTLSVTLVNGVASRPTPVTVDLESEGATELVRLRPRDPRQPWRYTWTWRWRPGSRHGEHATGVTYALPYFASARHVVVQASFGTPDHAEGSGFENAIDWAMPVGTPVLAARGGTVVAVRDDSTLGGPGREYDNCANYVVIRHDDGTSASYMHLEPGGALVKAGDRVAVGAPIGRSGNTGHSRGPHLHFDVFRNVDADNRVTFPLTFQTRDGLLQLKSGHAY